MNSPRLIGQQRALAALQMARETAEAGVTCNRLFPDLDPARLELADPVAPVTHVFATRHRNSEPSSLYIREIFETVRSIDRSIRTIAIEFSDFKGFRPIEADWSDPDSRLINHRDVRTRLVVCDGFTPVLETPWEVLPSALPWPWLRDILFPATVAAAGQRIPAFIQPFHWAVPVPLAGWLQAEFQDTGLAYSMYADGSEISTLTANHQNHGGGILPVTPRIAIVGAGMSAGLRSELERTGVTCVVSGVPTWTEHVDELYAVVPDRQSACRRALLYLQPHAADDDPATTETVSAISRATEAVIGRLRQLPALGGLRCFPVPAEASGQRLADFNPVNLVAVPLAEKVALLLGRPKVADREREIRRTFQDLGHSLGQPVELHFIDLARIDPRTAGGLHCAILELRAFDPAE